MPSILIRVLTWLMTSLAGQVMFSLGVGMLSFTAIDSVMGSITEKVRVYFVGTSETALIWINLFEIDYGVSVLLSAFIIKSMIMSAQVALTKRT